MPTKHIEFRLDELWCAVSVSIAAGVSAARAAGQTWAAIAEVLGTNASAATARYGPGADRNRARSRARNAREGEPMPGVSSAAAAAELGISIPTLRKRLAGSPLAAVHVLKKTRSVIRILDVEALR